MAKTLTITQGDAYPIPVPVTLDGERLNLSDIDTVEVTIGEGIRKVYPGEITYDSINERFLVPVTQEETFALPGDSTVEAHIRVKFISGAVLGATRKIYVATVESISKVVL